MNIDLSKLKAPLLTARQLQRWTQIAQILGGILVAKGVIAGEDWSLYFGAAVSVISLIFGEIDGGKNDHGTAALQDLVGAKTDARPGPETFGAAVERVLGEKK